MSSSSPGQTGRFAAHGAELAFQISGEGPAFVQLHGLGSSIVRARRSGLDMGPRLHGYRVLRYDARGHGRSTGRAIAEDYAWPRLAEDLMALLDELAPDAPVHACGASMGAATLLDAAARRPDRFASLSLLIPPTAWAGRAEQAQAYRKSAVLVENHGMETFARVRAMTPTPPAQADKPRDDVPAVSAALLPAVLRGAAVSDLPDPQRIRTLPVPTVVRTWVDDDAHPVPTAEQLHRLIPGSHLTIAETPDEVASWPACTAEFIAGLSDSPAVGSPS